MSSKDKYLSELKKYSTESIISTCSNWDRWYFHKMKLHENEPLKVDLSVKGGTFSTYFSPWYLPKIIYDSTSYNDYRSKVMKDNSIELNTIYGLFHNFYNDNEKFLETIEEKDNLISIILYGHIQEQSIYNFNAIARYIHRFNRQFYIMTKSSGFWVKELDEIFISKFDLNFNNVLDNLFTLFLLTYNQPCIDLAYALEESKYIKNSNFLEKVINSLKCTYIDCRKSSLKDFIFFSKPIIETQTKNRFVISNFLMLKYFSEFIYWTVKDYYNKGNKFVIEFGNIFEAFVYEILAKSYGKLSVHKIDKSDIEKRADFYIETDNIIIIFEIKAGIAKINCKKQNMNIEDFENFIKNNFNDAYDQIDNTIPALNKYQKKVFGIAINYDNLLVSETIGLHLKNHKLNNISIDKLLILNIDELEILLKKFDTLEKLENLFLSKTNSNETSLQSIIMKEISKYNIYNLYYENVFDKLIKFKKNDL